MYYHTLLFYPREHTSKNVASKTSNNCIKVLFKQQLLKLLPKSKSKTMKLFNQFLVSVFVISFLSRPSSAVPTNRWLIDDDVYDEYKCQDRQSTIPIKKKGKKKKLFNWTCNQIKENGWCDKKTLIRGTFPSVEGRKKLKGAALCPTSCGVGKCA